MATLYVPVANNRYLWTGPPYTGMETAKSPLYMGMWTLCNATKLPEYGHRDKLHLEINYNGARKSYVGCMCLPGNIAKRPRICGRSIWWLMTCRFTLFQT